MNAYHSMSIGEKQRATLAQAREQATVCLTCEAQVMPIDLVRHMNERCPGQRDPHPAAQWISWKEALAMGVPRRTLLFWIKRGHVRVRGERGDRRYLLRDLVRRTALSRRR